MRVVRAFTLVELLVVVAIIALLLAILLPALSRANQAALTVRDLSNIRNMEQAHWMYMTEWDGRFISVGLAHGGIHADEGVAWINTLQKQYGNKLLAKSPVDDSPHWPEEDGGEGVPVPGTTTQFRRTSYGVNSFLVDFGNGLNPYGPPPSGISPADWFGGDGKAYTRLNRVKRPSSTIHFLIMAFEGDYAGADHPHVEGWVEHPHPPTKAATQVQINAHGRSPRDKTWEARSNWGFLDGHAETLEFRDVLTDIEFNNFDPRVAQ